MTNSHVSQNQTATASVTNGLPLEADFEREMPTTGLIQRWAEHVHTSIQTRPYETIVRHRLEQWLIAQVTKHHPEGKIGAVRWFSILLLPREKGARLSSWANEMYRIITSETTDEQGDHPFCTPQEQEAMTTQLKNDLLARGITQGLITTWLLSKQMPRQPKRPEGPRQPIRTTIPPQERRRKERTQPVETHRSKPPVFTKDDYQPTDVEVAERIIQLQDQMRDIGATWDDVDLLETARRQIIAEHKRNVAA